MTQKKIAGMLNVSVATVSLALRDSSRVKEETKGKIKELARLTKYRPNLTAHSLLTGKTHMVGIISGLFSDPFHAELNDEMYHYLKKKNYAGMFIPIETPEEYQGAIETALSRKVDGLISVVEPNIEEVIMLKEEDVPVIFYQARGISSLPDYVGVDIYKGGYSATTHLINSGSKKIGFIGMVAENEERFRGYRDALHQHNLPIKKEWIMPVPGHPGNKHRKMGYNGIKKILSLKDRPTGILAFNDMVAIGAMQAIIAGGLRVPKDIAIIGFDNLEESKYLSVPLTTVDIPRKRIAKQLVEMLLTKIENRDEKPPQKIIVEPKLIIRKSCGFHLKERGSNQKGSDREK